MKITDLKVDLKSIGSKYWLVEVLPVYVYENGRRTDNISAYRYMIALPERNLEKIGVKVEGQQQLETPNGYVEVTFTDLELFIFWYNGDYQVGAKAKGITLVNQIKDKA